MSEMGQGQETAAAATATAANNTAAVETIIAAGSVGTEVPENYVCLVSSDGFEFIIEKELACISGFLRTTLDSGFLESQTRRIPLPEISGKLLEKVCQYFCYYKRYKNSKSERPEFHIPPEMAVELLMVSNYLDT